MDLADFLLARIAEDEENARGSGLVVKTFTREVTPGGMAAGIAVATYTLEQLKDAEPISDWVLHDERRVLAECEAKRRIIAKVTEGEWQGGYTLEPTILGALALPYVDHPDYQPQWNAVLGS